MAERLKIEERIALVKRELCEGGIGKDKKTNFGGKYSYRGVDSTMGTVSALHAKYGVNFSIDRIEHFHVEKSANNTHITCLFIMRFSASDDKSDYVEHTCIGEGLDQGDKASGKAHSYAYKNGMFAFYEIPVEGQNVDDYDPRIDNEDDSDQESKSTPMPKQVKDEVGKYKSPSNLELQNMRIAESGTDPNAEKSPGQNIKEHRDKKKAEAKSEEDQMKKDADKIAEDVIAQLQNYIHLVKEFVEDYPEKSTRELSEFQKIRSAMIGMLNEDRKRIKDGKPSQLNLSKEEKSGVDGLVKASKKKMDDLERSKTSSEVADLAKKKLDELG